MVQTRNSPGTRIEQFEFAGTEVLSTAMSVQKTRNRFRSARVTGEYEDARSIHKLRSGRRRLGGAVLCDAEVRGTRRLEGLLNPYGKIIQPGDRRGHRKLPSGGGRLVAQFN